MPSYIENQINNTLYEFIWGKKGKISCTTSTCKIEHGGIGMLDIKYHFEAIKASWVNVILNSDPNKAWSKIPKTVL